MKKAGSALALFALLAATNISAQPTEEQRAQWRAMREARGGEPAGPRPPEGATQEEKRVFYQKRAAERAQAEAVPAGSEHSAHAGQAPTERKAEGSGKTGKPAVAPTPTFAGTAPEQTRGGGAARPGGGAGGMGARGGGALWLSDSPPSRGDGPPRAGMGAMGGMNMGGERSGPPVKRLWLRAGTDPQKSGFAREDAEAPAETLLVRPQGSLAGEPLPPPEEGRKNLSFEMPVQGYYRLYVTTRKLQGDTLNVAVAKAEVSNFSHGGDEEERSQALVAPRVLESAPIEIVREKLPNEKMFFQLKSGEHQAFVVLQKGLPLQGARVRFVSHEGWTKEAVSDGQGRTSFQVVRDYFPPWDDFRKRFKATYLVIAEANAAEAGRHKDQPYGSVRYQATLAGSYYPSPDDYRSHAWGLGVSLLIVILCGIAVYLYRRRRTRPFREVRLDDAE
ncbi:MAG: hypothetical protein M0Q22_05715 [Sulfuritalea sp.]|jgi:hypothetical protein|nr:hypothetical protein [Sulfuritalea sp.]